MTYETTHQNYPVAHDGQRPWDQDYQDAMAMIDRDINQILTQGYVSQSTFQSHVGLVNAHHNRYTDGEARNAVLPITASDIQSGVTFSGSHTDLTDVRSSQHHNRYTDGEAIDAINTDPNHGTTASHNYFSGNYSDLSGKPSLFSGNYADLTNVPNKFAPQDHGDAAHIKNYAETNQLFSGNYVDLTNVPNKFTPTDHSHNGDSLVPDSVTAKTVSIDRLMYINPNSTTPSSVSKDAVYLDDGTNTSDGTIGFRYYDGTQWIDI